MTKLLSIPMVVLQSVLSLALLGAHAPVAAMPQESPAATEKATGRRESLAAYAEWWQNGALIVDGQRVRLIEGGKFKGSGEAKTFDQIPLGYEVKVKGRRDSDGVVRAEEVEAKPNGSALMEKEIREVFDEQEKKYLAERSMYDQDKKGKRKVHGRLETSGDQVDRVRAVFNRVVPPYLAKREFRVYVVDNKEWNAMAAPNDSIYVFSGLLADLDDDELAIVLGHELTHATHEHSLKQFKKNLVALLTTAAVVGAVEEGVKDKNTRGAIQLGAVLGGLAWTKGYGRGREDQADRVGLRYAAEGGFDFRKGPTLWNRFARKYGNSPKAINFFFGNHSVAKDREKNLARELAVNYSR